MATIQSRKFPKNPPQEITQEDWDKMGPDKNRTWIFTPDKDATAKVRPLDSEKKPAHTKPSKAEQD